MGEDEDDTIPVTTEASLDSEAQNIFKIFKSHIWGNDVRAAVFTAELLCRDRKGAIWLVTKTDVPSLLQSALHNGEEPCASAARLLTSLAFHCHSINVEGLKNPLQGFNESLQTSGIIAQLCKVAAQSVIQVYAWAVDETGSVQVRGRRFCPIEPAVALTLQSTSQCVALLVGILKALGYVIALDVTLSDQIAREDFPLHLLGLLFGDPSRLPTDLIVASLSFFAHFILAASGRAMLVTPPRIAVVTPYFDVSLDRHITAAATTLAANIGTIRGGGLILAQSGVLDALFALCSALDSSVTANHPAVPSLAHCLSILIESASDSLSARIAQYEPAIRILEAFAPDREWCPKAELVGWDPYANSGFHVDNIDTDYLHLKQSYGR